jgi:hypothetical protein
MRRIVALFGEWWRIRTRVREERQFHLEQSEKDWLSLGLSSGEARRVAQKRFGGNRSVREALRELDGDLPGLAHRFRACQLSSSAWLRPMGLAALAILLFIAGPEFTKALVMEPAEALWAGIGLMMPILLGARLLKTRWRWYWFLYGLFLLALHALVSTIGWAIAMQVWRRAPWPSDGAALLAFLGVLFAYVGAIAVQCRWWWRDLHQRCPICLEGLRLPLIEGTADCVLLAPVSVESVCIHGHGVLVENRWARRFRPSESPLDRLIRA